MAAKKKATPTSKGFSAEERAAMKEYVSEMKSGPTEGEPVVLAKIAAMPEPDRTLATRMHKLVMAAAPSLSPRTWYGMPAYSKGEKVICFFQNASKFKSRYSTLGFSDKARLDDGAMWPTSFAIDALTAAEEARITALVKKAVG